MDQDKDSSAPHGKKFGIKVKKKHRKGHKGVVISNKGALEAEAETNPEDPDVIDVPQPEFAGQSTSAHTSFRQIANTKRCKAVSKILEGESKPQNFQRSGSWLGTI